MQQPIYYAAMMVERGDAHTLIGGANMSYPDSLRPAMQTIDLMPGIEKVVASFADIPPLLTLLTRSATGQPITTYFNMISSPRKPGEKDGPQEVHLVLLDNGRSRMYVDAELQATLRCIRCGACANVCPVYSKVGGHKYGHVYIGAIGLILTLFYHGKENDRAIVRNCINCQACKEVCPVDIDLPHLIKKTYRAVLDQDGKTPG